MDESREYKTLIQYTTKIETAVKSNLTSLGGKLLSRNLISPENYAQLRDQSMSKEDRAAELVSLLQDRVKLKKENYGTFLDVLRTSGDHFNDILSMLPEFGSQQTTQASEVNQNHLDREKEIHIWCESTNGRGMTLVTAGQAGVGKSTLVKNLLRFPDEDAPVAAHSAKLNTKEVECYSRLIKNVNVTIIDTPGLAGASNNDEAKILAQLHEESKGRADMLLYCVSMAPNSKVGELDRKIINLLTTIFSQKIWERTIVVLTSADYVKERNEKKPGKPTVQAVMKEYATAFQKLLTGGMTVTPVLDNDGVMTRPAKEIAAVAAGETLDEEILPGMKWNECVYKEVLKKCSLEAIPEMFKLLEVSSGAWKGALGGAAAGAVAGAGIGVLAGGIGALPGAIGGAIGGAVAGGGVVRYSFENSDRGKLAKEYEDIMKQRKKEPEW